MRYKTRRLLPGAVFIVLLLLGGILEANDIVNLPEPVSMLFSPQDALAAAARPISGLLNYTFHVAGTLDEAGSMDGSSSPYFWMNSGGQLILKDGIGMTLQGPLGPSSKWAKLYAANNPLDTENGAKPQNLLRLVTRSKWQNVNQQAYFKVNRFNMTNSPNRNASNGILLMSRYNDNGQTLYYAGLRVDGAAVIKKKVRGTYTTLVYKTLFGNGKSYSPSAPPPYDLGGGKWIGLRSIAQNVSGGVKISLYMDKDRSGKWELIAETMDATSSAGGGAISQEGYAGIRTDFADVEFDDYRLSAL